VLKGHEAIDVIVHKHQGRWQTTEGKTGLSICAGDKRAEALERTLNHFDREAAREKGKTIADVIAAEVERVGLSPRWGGIVEAGIAQDPLLEMIAGNNRKRDQYAGEFHRIFGTPLSHWWNPMFGFDIVRFDDCFIESGDGVMAEAVRQKYGDRAVEIIQALC
jgi:hypothetical protein